MTKQREIEILDATIQQLGPDSYLGPWLSEHRAHIIADITNDHQVSAPLPGPAYREGRAIIEQAKAEAAELVQRAKAEAEKVRSDASAERQAIRERAAADLDTLVSAIRTGTDYRLRSRF